MKSFLRKALLSLLFYMHIPYFFKFLSLLFPFFFEIDSVKPCLDETFTPDRNRIHSGLTV